MRLYTWQPLTAIPDTRVRRNAAKLYRDAVRMSPHSTPVSGDGDAMAALALLSIGRVRVKFWGRGLVSVYALPRPIGGR